MAKDINVHVKTTGAGRAKQQLGSVGDAAKDVGNKTAEGQKRAQAATENTSQKLTGLGRVLQTVKSQAMGLVGAWLGLQGARTIINWLIAKLERIAELQKQIYERSLSFAEIGQALEFQTGTRGQQRFWTQQAIKLQKAGGLKAPEVAQQMLVSMDIAFAAQGGIRNEQIRQLARELAPFVGAGNLGPQEVSKAFEFAGTAQIAPTAEAYKQYFAKIHTGYTASKTTDFGQFVLGLQKGGTAYMAAGGTLDEAISIFSGALAVGANEALAATAVEQIARLSGGGYEKPRQAMERAMGVRWEDLSMDERTQTLLKHVRSIPEARRSQVLAEQGFPLELVTTMAKMVTPEAMGAMTGTRAKVTAAEPADVDQLTEAYLESTLARSRQTEARIAARQARSGPQFARWHEYIKELKASHEILMAEGRDSREVIDRLEPWVMAYRGMLARLDEIEEFLPEGRKPEAGKLREQIETSIGIRSGFLLTPGITRGMSERAGYDYARRLYELEQLAEPEQIPRPLEFEQPADAPGAARADLESKIGPQDTPTDPTVPFDDRVRRMQDSSVDLPGGPARQTVIFDNSINYYPRVGSDESGPRVNRNIR